MIAGCMFNVDSRINKNACSNATQSVCLHAQLSIAMVIAQLIRLLSLSQ